jgi:high-affinity Fe2+/Pb2+ permease
MSDYTAITEMFMEQETAVTVAIIFAVAIILCGCAIGYGLYRGMRARK